MSFLAIQLSSFPVGNLLEKIVAYDMKLYLASILHPLESRIKPVSGEISINSPMIGSLLNYS